MKVIKTKLTLKDFINANMVLLYRRPATLIFTALGGLFFLFFLFVLVVNPRAAMGSLFLAPFLIAGITPLMTFIKARTLYNAPNSGVKQMIEYEFQDHQFAFRSETFNAQFNWDKIYKVTGTKNWIFIWQNKMVANPIPKKDIWEGEIMKLKEILEANKVKNNL